MSNKKPYARKPAARKKASRPKRDARKPETLRANQRVPSHGARPGTPERLQKVLANAGYGSRREIEALIKSGDVKVDGQVVELGFRATGEESITLRGRHINQRRLLIQHQTIAYHKPEGELVSRKDPEGRPVVFTKLPKPESGRWVAVGRLDLNTSGLLLLTTDGALANKLMHPSSRVPREYAVRVRGTVDKAMTERLVSGVQLEDGIARFEDIFDSGGSGQNHWFHVVIAEGRNREVRRLWESQECSVSRLKRVRYGPVEIGGLRPGQWRELKRDELKKLYEAVQPEKEPEENADVES